LRAADLARRAGRIAVVVAMVLAALALAACTTQSGPQPSGQHFTGDLNPPGFFPGAVATTQGKEAAGLYPLIFVVATIVFVLVEGLLIIIAFRFRRRSGEKDLALPTQTHGNSMLEFGWTIIPAVVVAVLFVGTFKTLADTDVLSAHPQVTVDVTAFQWQWNFKYPDFPDASGQPLSYTGQGKNGPEMVLPAGETARIRLHAQDVIHSWYVPSFFFKRDAIPGRVNEFDITPVDVGTYGGQCAEFCGLAHNEMYFSVRIVSPPDFAIWAAAEQAKGAATPPPPPPSGGPPPSGASGGSASISVSSISATAGFDPSTLTAPADTPLTIQLVNKDPSVPHNFAIQKGNADGSDFVGQPIANGGQTATYQAPPLKAGTYTFYCAIHPNMKGTLTVGG
jgi:cytochrome c oxidase subunit 2